MKISRKNEKIHIFNNKKAYIILKVVLRVSKSSAHLFRNSSHFKCDNFMTKKIAVARISIEFSKQVNKVYKYANNLGPRISL